jgi:hypothetical protein
MLDSVIGVFDDREDARRALDGLKDDGWPVADISMKRVRRMPYRGLADSEKAHSLMYAPEVPDSAPLAEDEGIPLVIVKVERDRVGEAVEALSRAGADETQVVEATPPIDL